VRSCIEGVVVSWLKIYSEISAELVLTGEIFRLVNNAAILFYSIYCTPMFNKAPFVLTEGLVI
jgi:hypothetical protein